MSFKTHRLVPAALAAAGALAGFFLRRWQLDAIFDEMGLALRGHVSTVVLAVFCAALTVGLALCARGLTPKDGYEASFSSGAPELVVSAAAAALLLFSSMLSLMEDHTAIMLAVGFLGILASFCIGIVAAQRFRGVVPSLAMHILPPVFLTVRLIVVFRQWTTDPVVQEYCYRLFAGIAAMCATLHLAEYCVGRGRRRLSAFWCLAGVVFSVIAAADAGWVDRLLNGAVCLWCAANAWQLLED